jgi:hypothetical protein
MSTFAVTVPFVVTVPFAETVLEPVAKFVAESVAPGTLRRYKRKWIKWLAFAREHGYRLAPPQVLALEDYLVSVVTKRKSVAAIESVSASVNWHCAEVRSPSPFLDRRVALLVRGMKARFRRPVVPRLPFSRSHIRKFMRRAQVSLRHWRAAVVMAVCFQDFLWFSISLENGHHIKKGLEWLVS